MPEVEKVVLLVDIHCQACKAKVRKCLAGFPGLESIEFNMEERKVSLKGKLDPRRVYEAVKRKSGKRTVLLFPLPLLQNNNKEGTKDAAQEEQKKLIEPEQEAEESVVLKAKMHCDACVREVTRTIQKMKVKVDSVEEKVIVRGRNLNPKKICDRVRRKTHKILDYLPTPPLEEEKKEEAKKVEESSTEEAENKKGMENKVEDNKEDKKKDLEEKEGDAKAEEDGHKQHNTKVEEELVNVNSEEEIVIEMKKCGYTPFQSISSYTTYPPQLFSDENPNACCIM